MRTGDIACRQEISEQAWHRERDAEELENELIDRCPWSEGPIECTERLGGLLRFYSRAV